MQKFFFLSTKKFWGEYANFFRLGIENKTFFWHPDAHDTVGAAYFSPNQNAYNVSMRIV